MLVDCDQIHWDSRKIISRINREILLYYIDILILSENSKGNFVKFGGELGWVDKIHVFLPALLISQKRSGYNGPTPIGNHPLLILF